MGETRVDLLHLLEDLRDAYPGATEETILTEIVANSLDSGATTITITADPTAPALTIVDDGMGMRRRELARYHDIAASTKVRGERIEFAGVGIKRSEEHTSELQSQFHLVCRLLLEKKKKKNKQYSQPYQTNQHITTYIRR